MSARNPTDFNAFVDMSQLRGGEKVTTTSPSSVVDDQMFILDKAEMVICAPGLFYSETVTGSWVQQTIFYVDCKDMCGVDGVTNNEIECSVFAQAWCDGGDGKIRITSGAVANNDINITNVGSVVPSDYPLFESVGTLNLKTNGTENTITVYLQAGAADTTFLHGLFIVANET
jgi:hypothetical protein